MSKKVLVLIAVCFGLFMSSCSTTGSKAMDVGPNSSEQMPVSEDTGQKTVPAADGGLTLEKLKEEAVNLGYEIAPISDFQFMGEPTPSDGFNVHYIDSSSDTLIPVLEFGSPDEAIKYAEGVNADGYNLCIINDRFVTMTEARYGVVTNDNEAAFLAGLMKGEVMAAPKRSGSTAVTYTKDYAGACKQIDAITKALNTLVNNAVLTHDKSAPEDKNFSAAFISFNMLTSGNLSFTSYLSEDENERNILAQIWTGLGVADMKVERTDAHTYQLSGLRMGAASSFMIHCAYSPSTGALQLVETDGDRVVELFEFVPLGGDKYAF